VVRFVVSRRADRPKELAGTHGSAAQTFRSVARGGRVAIARVTAAAGLASYGDRLLGEAGVPKADDPWSAEG
jgi:hypothetical protein